MIKRLGQALCFLLFGLGIGFLSVAPSYHHFDADKAMVRMSIAHAGQLLGSCHQRTDAELAKLSRNMRALEDCPRERSPVTIEMELDGKVLYHEVIAPSGLSRDGASTVYGRFPLPAGEHRLSVKMKDNDKQAGFNFQRSETINLRPAQVLVIDFNRQQGGLLFKLR